MYAIKQEKQLFYPIISIDPEIVEWFDYELIPAIDLQWDNLIYVSLCGGEPENVTIRDIKYKLGGVVLTVSALGSDKYITDVFNCNELFMRSARYSFNEPFEEF